MMQHKDSFSLTQQFRHSRTLGCCGYIKNFMIDYSFHIFTFLLEIQLAENRIKRFITFSQTVLCKSNDCEF